MLRYSQGLSSPHALFPLSVNVGCPDSALQWHEIPQKMQKYENECFLCCGRKKYFEIGFFFRPISNRSTMQTLLNHALTKLELTRGGKHRGPIISTYTPLNITARRGSLSWHTLQFIGRHGSHLTPAPDNGCYSRIPPKEVLSPPQEKVLIQNAYKSEHKNAQNKNWNLEMSK